MAALTGSGVFIQGSPPSNRQTFWPAASSSMTRLRTLTISEKPTLSKRFAVGGNDPSLTSPPSSDRSLPAGAHQEVENHPDHRQEDHQESPQDLRPRIGAALQDRHDRDDVENEDDEPEKAIHGCLLPLYNFSEI